MLFETSRRILVPAWNTFRLPIDPRTIDGMQQSDAREGDRVTSKDLPFELGHPMWPTTGIDPLSASRPARQTYWCGISAAKWEQYVREVHGLADYKKYVARFRVLVPGSFDYRKAKDVPREHQ